MSGNESVRQAGNGLIATSDPQRAAQARRYRPANAWSRTKREIGGTLPATIPNRAESMR